MKGVVLAGGLGTRLHPLTKITNKHLLPVYDRAMVYYPIQMLVEAGIDDIIILTGGDYAGDFLRLIGNGEDFGLSRIHYAYQSGQGGIAEALGLTRQFTGDDKMVVVLGDNILQQSIKPAVEAFDKQERGARIFLTEVEHPWEYGIAVTEGDSIKSIIEKPKDPPTNTAVIGVYMYPPDVFDIVDQLEPSRRGELEITDVNNAYLRQGNLQASKLDGWWTDAGTFDSLLRAGTLVAKSGANKQR